MENWSNNDASWLFLFYFHDLLSCFNSDRRAVWHAAMVFSRALSRWLRKCERISFLSKLLPTVLLWSLIVVRKCMYFDEEEYVQLRVSFRIMEVGVVDAMLSALLIAFNFLYNWWFNDDRRVGYYRILWLLDALRISRTSSLARNISWPTVICDVFRLEKS